MIFTEEPSARRLLLWTKTNADLWDYASLYQTVKFSSTVPNNQYNDMNTTLSDGYKGLTGDAAKDSPGR
ncbi:hypothetical protein AB4Y89_09925 [Terriglobus sp. 2YAB30_2]